MPAASLQEPEKASPIALCHPKKQPDRIEYCTHKLTQRIYTTNIYLDITCSVMAGVGDTSKISVVNLQGTEAL